jgi:hypothetical protein
MTVPGGIASARVENAEMEDCLGERVKFELTGDLCSRQQAIKNRRANDHSRRPLRMRFDR